MERFYPHTIIIGYDHRFGRDRKGNYKMLKKFQQAYKFQVKEIPRHVLDDISISSTKIRDAIINGNIDSANTLLGYDYFFEGIVMHGDKLGRQLGYPTANIKISDDEKLSPGDGIYTVYCAVKNEEGNYGPTYGGMMSVGFRPTVDGKKRVIEVNIFDFKEEIYGATVRVYVKAFLRAEEKFDNLGDLVKRIDEDKVNSLQILSGL